MIFTGNIGNATTTSTTIQANSNITGTGIVSGTTTTITSTGGSIGDFTNNVRLRTTAGTLNLNATNSTQLVYVQETDAVTLNVDVNDLTGFVDVTAGGTMTIGSAMTANSIFLDHHWCYKRYQFG